MSLGKGHTVACSLERNDLVGWCPTLWVILVSLSVWVELEVSTHPATGSQCTVVSSAVMGQNVLLPSTCMAAQFCTSCCHSICFWCSQRCTLAWQTWPESYGKMYSAVTKWTSSCHLRWPLSGLYWSLSTQSGAWLPVVIVDFNDQCISCPPLVVIAGVKWSVCPG